MTKEEQRILAGQLFAPGDQELRELKLRAHNLCSAYNQTFEDETDKRERIVRELFAQFGEDSFCQGPIFIHYGVHIRIGKRLFANFNLTIQDDGPVTIGDDCNFGPNVTIVTPVHPMLAQERRFFTMADGTRKHMCYAKPVVIGSDCWFGANVVVCPGVTIGPGCVIGAGSVVTRDVPAQSFAAGNPCRVIRPITQGDSVLLRPELIQGLEIKG